MATKINESAVKRLATEPIGKIRRAWDADLRGFGTQVTATGAVGFVVYYRTANGIARKMKIGSWPALSAAQARALAENVLAKVALGEDPCAERRQSRQRGVTVAEVIEVYLADGTLGLKASTLQDLSRALRNHVVPVLGGMELATLKVSDLKRLGSEVAAGRTRTDRRGKPGSRSRSIVHGGPGAAAKVQRYAKAFLGWANEHGYVEVNVGADLSVPQSNTRTRSFTSAEVKAITSALAEIETETPRLAVQVAALRLLLLTGLRKREVLNLRWQDVDAGAGVLRLPDTKTGARTVALAPAVLAWLLRLPRRNPVMVFPSSDAAGSKPLSDVRGAWDAVRAKAKLGGSGLDAPVVHSLRHSVVTNGLEAGLAPQLLMAVTGHRTVEAFARYAHIKPSDPIRAVAAALAAPMAEALGIGAEVLDLSPESRAKSA